jgi:predicted ester cyclase
VTTVERNKAALERAARNFSPSTLEEYLQLYDENVQLHFLPPGLPRGRAGARMFYQGFFAAFPDARLTLQDPIGEDDKVACHFRVEGTHRGELFGVAPTHKRVEFSGVTMFTFRDGRCVERWSETNLPVVLQQLSATA